MEEEWTAGILTGEMALVENEKRRAKLLTDMEAHYNMNLECAATALTEIDFLAADDREAIESAARWLKFWWPIFVKSNDPAELREAAYYLMAHAHIIGSRCTICDTEAEFWRRAAPKAAKRRAPTRKHGRIGPCLLSQSVLISNR